MNPSPAEREYTINTAGISPKDADSHPALIRIRPMTREDLSEVARLEQQIFPDPWTREEFETMLLSPYTIYLVVTQEEKIEAYCGLFRSFEDADIQNVAVAGSCRNRGIAYRMLKVLMDEGRKQGIENFTLEVRVTNAPAIRVYEKLGFKTEGRRYNFYEQPREAALSMRCRKGKEK